MSTVLSQQEFLQQVSEHKMSVLSEIGLHRHIRFKKPGTIDKFFDLITWPGHLLITGDMGSYLFKRLEDMFNFFETDQGRINPGYWGEKLQSVDKHNGFREWDRDKFKKCVLEGFDEWLSGEEDMDYDEVEEAKNLFYEDVLDPLEFCSKEEAYRYASDFTVRESCPFQDFWEVDTDEYTYHYLWACHAIVWGIQQYRNRGR